MSESSQDNINNPDGSITSVPTRFPYVPATPEPSPQNPVVSKDITVNRSKSTWMRLYVPTAALNGGSSEKLPLVVYYHGGGFATGSVDFYPHHDFCNLMARELNAVFASHSPGGVQRRSGCSGSRQSSSSVTYPWIDLTPAVLRRRGALRV
uniref:Alpha/beta hydrolase fold-3 domain-containing protein n=1 Tax=Brassica oleracea TaxID=3712 RepID=A0A3P6DVN0_BRAOL|nr:unnamed protein product [Brassica oleracea]